MAGYVLKRLAWAAVLFLTLTVVTYIIFFVLPSDAARIQRGRASVSIGFREAADLQGSVVEEYAEFVYRLLTQGALGTSFFSERSVNSIIADAFPVTLALVVGGAVVWLLIAIPVGVISALRPRSLVDRASMVLVLAGVSAHPIWIGLLLSYLLGAKLGWFPITGYCDFFNPSTQCGGPWEWFRHMILPWLSFALLFGAFYTRMIRAQVAEALQEDFVRTARAKGASELEVVRRHVLRHAMLPVVALLSADIGGLALGLVGQSLFIENVYGLPGLGKVLISSLQRHDLPVIAGVVVVVTGTVVVVNFVADVVYALIDPRVKARVATRPA